MPSLPMDGGDNLRALFSAERQTPRSWDLTLPLEAVWSASRWSRSNLRRSTSPLA